LDKALQQRLIGAILLVALGVIFIPVLLDGSGFKSRNSRSIEMPAEPEFPPLSEITLEPVVPTHVKQKSANDTARDSASGKPKTKTALKQPGNAFALQVSTVTIRDNAYALRDKLRKDGYAAYVESSTRNGKTSYRVRIGPELDMSRLEKMKATLSKKEGLDGFIVNHP
jgi:DedD protein